VDVFDSPLFVDVQRRSGTVRVVLAGACSAMTAPELVTAVRSVLRRGADRVELDLDAVAEIDNEGLFAFLDLYRSAKAAGVYLTLTHVPPHIRDLLGQTLLADVLIIE
jgi:anti-anti-sigma factor